MAYTHSDIEGALPLLTSGKVRDLYEVNPSTLLFVATDRISAYDVIMENVSKDISNLCNTKHSNSYRDLSIIPPCTYALTIDSFTNTQPLPPSHRASPTKAKSSLS